MADDGFDRFYADRLWQLLPAMVRAADSDTPGGVGPLRALVDRIGAAAADSRRSIDALERLGSIETADDWAIAYHADLLATRLVGAMDARAQRLDVARTIAYRRRAGTLALIELLAFDVTGHAARATEFFRRLGRTRHAFDPAIGGDPALAVDARLIGRATATPAGGSADLRDAWGATASDSAFDEFAHTADFRRPAQTQGHHAIPRIGVFLWWLHAYPIDGATPVARTGCPNEFSFDPTGRDTPLRGGGGRSRTTLGEAWTSPDPWESPMAIPDLLFAASAPHFYPDALSVDLAGGGTPAPAPLPSLAIVPEQGRFRFPGGAPAGEFLSRYHHGFAGPVGAQGQPDTMPPVDDEPIPPRLVTGGTWGTALAGPIAARTVILDDSRTYPGPTAAIAIAAGGALVVKGRSGRRPLLRWPRNAVVRFTGGDAATRLVLRNLHWQGASIELAGTFDSVTITQATLDPGSLAANAIDVARAIDGVELVGTTISVVGHVADLKVERSIAGPIATAAGGSIGRLTIVDSIVQSIARGPALATASGEIDVIRSTILGHCTVHRISASGAIFDDIATVADPQHGCVRFTTYATGSSLHAPYRSVALPRRSALFRSRRFGDPDYARLVRDVDRAIRAPAPGESIVSGGEDGCETGAFASERVALKTRALRIKLEEFMPIGTIAVPIDAD
jgi:hypothetical protein